MSYFDSGGTAPDMVDVPESNQPVVAEPDPECNTPLENVVDTMHSEATPSIQQVPPASASLPGNFS